jgi:hypothetical protein
MPCRYSFKIITDYSFRILYKYKIKFVNTSNKTIEEQNLQVFCFQLNEVSDKYGTTAKINPFK